MLGGEQQASWRVRRLTARAVGVCRMPEDNALWHAWVRAISLESPVSTSLFELEVQVLSLGPTERAHLLERLIDSFEPESKVRDAWIAEARRRHEEVKSGKVTPVPGAEAIARIRARIA